MTKLSKENAPRVESMPGFEGRYVETDGYIIGFEDFEEGGDFTPFFKGLPNDQCQSSHWGYVFSGAITLHYTDGDEVVSAGEAYYARPGHTGDVAPGTHILEFSPADEYAKTMDVVMRNIESMS